jgi:hypothetical protein
MNSNLSMYIFISLVVIGAVIIIIYYSNLKRPYYADEEFIITPYEDETNLNGLTSVQNPTKVECLNMYNTSPTGASHHNQGLSIARLNTTYGGEGTRTCSRLNQDNTIPIWTYWEGGSSALVDLCLKRINESCLKSSTFEHIHLDSKNLKDYLDDIERHNCFCEKYPALKSDIIRLSLLKKYGGLWLDSTVLISSVELLINMNKLYCFQAFYNPRNIVGVEPSEYPVIETSFMYAPKNHNLVVAWLDSLNILKCCSKLSRQNHVKNMGVSKNLKNLRFDYHIVYFSLFKFIKDMGGISNIKNIILKNMDACQYFICNRSFNVNDFFVLSSKKFIKKYILKFCNSMKFTSTDRIFIDSNINNARKDSFLFNPEFKRAMLVPDIKDI